jgi:hypothetical protein
MILSMLALGLPAAAQVDDHSALVAALRHVKGQQIGLTVTLERRPLAVRGGHIAGLSTQDDALRAAAVADFLRASVGTVDTVRQCDRRTPRDCRLVGTSMLVAFSDPVISGDSAAVYLRIWSYDPSYKRQPVGTSDARIVLQRVNGRWEFLREDILRQS